MSPSLMVLRVEHTLLTSCSKLVCDGQRTWKGLRYPPNGLKLLWPQLPGEPLPREKLRAEMTQGLQRTVTVPASDLKWHVHEQLPCQEARHEDGKPDSRLGKPPAAHQQPNQAALQ